MAACALHGEHRHGAFAEDAADRLKLHVVVVARPGSVPDHGPDVVRGEPGFLQGVYDGFGKCLAVGHGSGDVDRVAAHAAGSEHGTRLQTEFRGFLRGADVHDGGGVAEQKSVAVAVVRTRNGAGEGAERGEAGEQEFADVIGPDHDRGIQTPAADVAEERDERRVRGGAGGGNDAAVVLFADLQGAFQKHVAGAAAFGIVDVFDLADGAGEEQFGVAGHLFRGRREVIQEECGDLLRPVHVGSGRERGERSGEFFVVEPGAVGEDGAVAQQAVPARVHAGAERGVQIAVDDYGGAVIHDGTHRPSSASGSLPRKRGYARVG